MVFSSTIFLFVFLPALLLLYYLPVSFAKNRWWRNGILLIASVGFYAWGEPIFVYLMLLSVLLNWGIALVMSKRRRKKAWLIIAVAYDILLIGVFKYASFISKNLAMLTRNDSLIVEIALPIGISFFTFQMMSYVFDVYYGSSKPQKNPLYVALYISFFPQLIAGPIVRYQQIEREIVSRTESFDDFSDGMVRFVYGLGKKMLLANFLAQIADNIFDFTQNPSIMTAWLGAIAYTMQIYFDFSGYSDMAIGLGKMFGFHFLENFNYPYTAKSVTEFWRRWHISLSTWFRDYVYIPMGGNRVNRSKWVFNLFVVWLLTGIWHGANWTFVLWGLIYFAVLLVEKLTGLVSKTGGVLTRIYTLLIVVLAWVVFRSSDIGSGAKYIGNMVGIGAGGIIDEGFVASIRGTYVILVASIIGCTPLVSNLFSKLRGSKLYWLEQIWILSIFALSAMEIVSSSYNPFIYFNF